MMRKSADTYMTHKITSRSWRLKFSSAVSDSSKKIRLQGNFKTRWDWMQNICGRNTTHAIFTWLLLGVSENLVGFVHTLPNVCFETLPECRVFHVHLLHREPTGKIHRYCMQTAPQGLSAAETHHPPLCPVEMMER